MTNLAERLDSFPEPWKASKGDKLIGELVDLDMRDSEYGDPYPILTVDAGDGSTMDGDPIRGEHAWHAFHTMARNEVAKKRPQIGEQVGISYHGKGQAAPGMNAPERWRLIVDRPRSEQPPIDWDAIAAQPEPAATPEPAAAASDDDIPF
jgi:hypothetical protein